MMTLSAARAKLNRLAKKHGLEIHIGGERGYYLNGRYINAYYDYCVEVYPPAGYSFGPDRLHCLVCHHAQDWLEVGYDSIVHQAYAEAVRRVEELPLEDCDCCQKEAN